MTVTVQFTGYSLQGFRPNALFRRPTVVLTVGQIQRAVADYYLISVQEMWSPCRARSVARPRQVAMYLCRCHTPRSFTEIGRKFGGRDHTTVIHAIRQVEKLCAGDGDLAEDLGIIRRLLGVEAAR